MARRGPFLPVDIAEAAIADTKPKPFALPDYYTPDVPDAAPNVEGWTPQPMGGPASSMDEYRQGLAELERARRGESLGTAPELTDPLARRYLAPGLEGRFSLLDVGGVGRGTALSLLQGQNPAERSLTEDVTAIRGIDVPGVRSLPDRGLSFNLPEQLPVVGGANINLTPKTVGGFVVENIADPTTYIGIGGANAIKGEIDDVSAAAIARGRAAARRGGTWMEAADNALAEASGATEAAIRRQAPEAFQFGRVPETDELFTFGPQGEKVGPTGAVREIRLGREPRMGENVNEGLRYTRLGRAEMEQLAEADRAAFQSAYDRSIAGAERGIGGGAGITPDEFARLAAKKAAGEALTPEEQDSVLQALGKAMGATTADEQAAAREALYNGPVPTDMREVDTGLIEGVRRRLGAPTGATVEDALGRARQVEQGAPEGDVLAARIPNPLPMSVRARNTAAAEAGQRVGNLLRPRGLEQLGPDATVSDVIGVAQDTRRMVESQQIALSSRAKTYVEALGPTVKDGAGNYRLRNVIKADGAPALLQDVLENPARYPLTPEQAKAVADYQALVQAVRDEPRTFGVKVRTTGLEDGQSYIPRQAAAGTSGTALEARGGGAAGARLRSMREKGRVFRDPEQAARAGVVYEHPLTAFQSYVRQNLEGAANQHIASMLKTFGETAADRVDPSLRGQWQSLRERISARRKTLAGQQARAASVNRAADEAIRESERANRLAVSAEVRAMLKKAKIEEFDVSTPDEIVQSFPSMESLRTEADALRAQLARRTGARGVARRLGEKEALISLRSAAEQSGGDVDRMVEILSQYAEDSARFQTETASRYAGRGATAPAFGTAERAQWEADRAASGIRKNRGPQRMAVGVEAPFDGPEAAYRAYDEIVSHAIDNSIVWTSRQPGTQAGIKAADAELRVMIREARRADAAAERAGARSVAGESARARTWAEITNLQQERDALKHRWELAQERANQVPAGRARVDQNAAPALIGTDFAEKDAKRISRYYANGILPQNAIGDVLRGAAKVNRAIIPMQAIGDASATLRQLGTVLPSHPITFAQNFGKAARDLFPGGQARYREWLASPEVQDAASRGLALVGEGGVPNDFHASWFSRVPVLKQAQQHFEMISNRNRVDIFNQDVDMMRRTGQRVDDAAMEQVARNANRITGVANNRATDAETLTEFAANWMRSRLETLTKAVADGGIEGQLARGYLKNYVATGLIAAGAAAMASGRDPREVLNPIQERNGRFSYNPNFGTVRVGGVDVDMFGSYSDLARLAVMAADAGYGALTERDLTELAKPLIYAARTKGAPWLSTSADVATGENIVGEPVNSWTYWLTKPIPINAAVAVRNEQEGKPFLPSVAEGVAQFFGARANQLTPTERVQQGEYGQMSPQQQFKAIPAQAWRITVQQAPEQYKAVARYDSASAFYQALVDEYRHGWIERGASPLEAEAKARASAARHPVYRAFQNARNYYENQWTAQNPEQRQADAEAQLNLPPSERRNMPRQQERQIIEKAKQTPTPTPAPRSESKYAR